MSSLPRFKNMRVKEIERTANLAWSPSDQYPILLAAGTAAQQLDASFSTSAALELYDVNLGDPALDMELCTSTSSQFRFHKLCWGSYGNSAKGLLVAGCDEGYLQIYDVGKLLKFEHSLVSSQHRHTGPVRALDFNSFQKNLLATGASNSEIFIWDLTNTSTPMTPGATAQPPDDISSLAWNKQVQHILATTFSTRCIVWDLRKNEPIIKLTDTSKIRWKVVCWNPDVATQLCLASEDDHCPAIQMWDLRFATSPIKVFEGHQKGVLSMAWCDQDPDLLVSCGKDNKLIGWNPNTSSNEGEIVCDMTLDTQWNFEVNWCPRNPFLLASSSFDGHARIYSLSGGQPPALTSNKIADSFPGVNQFAHSMPPQQLQHQNQPHQNVVELRRPPKWMKKSCGVKLAFGGKLVSFGSEDKVVFVSQVVTEPDLMLRTKELEDVLEHKKFLEYCAKKIDGSTDAGHRDIWNFIASQFYGDNVKGEMRSLLGTSDSLLEERLKRLNLNHFLQNTRKNDDFQAATHIGPADSEDFFSGLNNQSASTANDSTEEKRLRVKRECATDMECAIQDALLLGNIKVAVDLCLNEGKMADAFILAVAGGPDLVAKVQAKYFERSENNLTDLISAVVVGNWDEVIECCDLNDWKRILVALMTYTKADEFRTYCELLGKRLQMKGTKEWNNNALICFISAGNINNVLENWTIDKATFEAIQELAEVGLILREALLSQGVMYECSGALAGALERYAQLLASQGYLMAAFTYLGESQDEKLQMLKERLMYALGLKTLYCAKQEATVKPNNYYEQQQQQTYGRVPSGAPKSIVKPYSLSGPPSMSVNPSFAPPTTAQAHFSGVGTREQTTADLFNGGIPGRGQTTAATATRNTATPPAPPTDTYNHARKPSDHGIPPQSKNKHVLDPSVQGGPAYKGFGTYPNQHTNAVSPFSSISDYNAFEANAAPAFGSLSRTSSELQFQPSNQAFPPQQPTFPPTASTQGVFPQGQSQAKFLPPSQGQGQTMFPPSKDQGTFPPPPSQGGFSPSPIQKTFPPSQGTTAFPSNPPQAAFPAPQQKSFPPSSQQPQPQSFPPVQPQAVKFPPHNATPPFSQQKTNQPSFQVEQKPCQTPFPLASNAPLKQPQGVTPYQQQPFQPPSRQQQFQQNQQMGQNAFVPSAPASMPPPAVCSPQPGWNDPPPMAFNKPAKVNANASANKFSANPITHPMYGQSEQSQMPPDPSAVTGNVVSAPLPMQQQQRYENVGNGYAENALVRRMEPHAASVPEAKPKLPLPEEHVHLRTILEELHHQCYGKTTNSQMKRKLDDVNRKLELMYDCIREGKLSPQTIAGLHEIVQMIQSANYQGCLAIITRMVSGPEFSAIANFISGIKVLIQSSLQLDVYL